MGEQTKDEGLIRSRRGLLLAISGTGFLALTAIRFPGFVGEALADDDDDRSRRRHRPVGSRGRTRRRRDDDRHED